MLQPKLRTVVLIAGVVSAGCWTPQHGTDVWPEHALDRGRSTSVGEHEAARRLTNPVEPREDHTPRPGDSVVYAIEVETPASAYRRYLRLTVQAVADGLVERHSATITQTPTGGEPRETRFHSRVYPVRIELFDADLQRLDESIATQAMVELLAMGFTRSCRAYLATGGKFATVEESLAASLLDAPAIFSIGFLLQHDDTLYDLALDLVDKSLALTALWNFGIQFSIEPMLQHVEVVELDPVWGSPGFRFPVQFRVNGRPALRIAATVVEPVAPLGLTAGITRVDGFRPTDDRYRFRVTLVRPHSRLE